MDFRTFRITSLPVFAALGYALNLYGFETAVVALLGLIGVNQAYTSVRVVE